MIEFVKAHGIAPPVHFPERSFAKQYAEAMQQRIKELEQEKIIVHRNDYYQLAFNWEQQLKLLVQRNEREQQLVLEYQLGLRDKNHQSHHKKQQAHQQVHSNTPEKTHKKGQQKTQDNQHQR